MNHIEQLRNAYCAGAIAKHDYIREMHLLHELLFEYPALLLGTDIARIEITQDGIVMTARASGLQLECDPTDERIVPIGILQLRPLRAGSPRHGPRSGARRNTVLDIGANVGWYAMNLARARRVDVLAFEPIEDLRHLAAEPGTERHYARPCIQFRILEARGGPGLLLLPGGIGNASLANLSGKDDVRRSAAT
jgi:hypothetical protein